MKPEVRYKMHLMMKEGYVECYVDGCQQLYLGGSDRYYVHLLFTHNVYLERCLTFTKKLSNRRVILCWSLRPIARRMKGRYKQTLRQRKVILWRCNINKFFAQIDPHKINGWYE